MLAGNLRCYGETPPSDQQKMRARYYFSTRIKDAGIAVRHSQGRILFYTAGSRNGLEGLDGNGPRPPFMKKGSSNSEKGVRKFPDATKTTKTAISRQLRIQIIHS